MQKQKDKELAELNKVESLVKPTMALCATCGKSINASGLEKHTRLCNYTSKSIKRRKIEKLEEITNKIDSDEKDRIKRINTCEKLNDITKSGNQLFEFNQNHYAGGNLNYDFKEN